MDLMGLGSSSDLGDMLEQLIGFGGHTTYSSIAYAGIVFLVMSIISFIGAIVGTVILYRKYVSDMVPGRPRQKWSWRTFFRFDRLILEPILKALFIFNALLITFNTITYIISSTVAGGVGAFFIGLILGAITWFLSEVVLRVLYELLISWVIVVRNTNEIRHEVCGDTPQPAVTPYRPATAQAGGYNAYANQPVARPVASSSVAAPVQAPEVGNAARSYWTCSCGRTGNTGNFCSACGRPRP